MSTFVKKRHEPCHLFLEDAFGESHRARLLQAGYPGVELFREHFKDARSAVEQSVKDPRIIDLCDKNCWLIVTPDSSMHLTHTQKIKKTQVAILATAHNSAEDMDEWIEGLILAKAQVERYFRKFQRPWFATFTRQGKVSSIKTIGPDAKCRRNRPAEWGYVEEVIEASQPE